MIYWTYLVVMWSLSSTSPSSLSQPGNELTHNIARKKLSTFSTLWLSRLERTITLLAHHTIPRGSRPRTPCADGPHCDCCAWVPGLLRRAHPVDMTACHWVHALGVSGGVHVRVALSWSRPVSIHDFWSCDRSYTSLRVGCSSACIPDLHQGPTPTPSPSMNGTVTP